VLPVNLVPLLHVVATSRYNYFMLQPLNTVLLGTNTITGYCYYYYYYHH
jgi:hypothetical protein